MSMFSLPRSRLFGIVALAVMAPPSAAQTTIEVAPAVDFYVEDTDRDGTFDVVRDGPLQLLVGTTNTAAHRVALEFDFAVIPDGSRITAASLSLRRVSGSLFQPDVDLHGYPSQTADGLASVGDVTYLGNPLILGQPVPFGTTWLTFEHPNLLDFVGTTYARGESHVGLMLKISDESGGNALHELVSVENFPANAPKLALTFEPAPAVPVLWPGGSAVLVGALLLAGIASAKGSISALEQKTGSSRC